VTQPTLIAMLGNQFRVSDTPISRQRHNGETFYYINDNVFCNDPYDVGIFQREGTIKFSTTAHHTWATAFLRLHLHLGLHETLVMRETNYAWFVFVLCGIGLCWRL